MDWRVVAVAIVFSLYLGVLGGTRREGDRRDVVLALVLTFVAGIGLLVTGPDTESAELAAISLSVGPPVAVLTILALARLRS